MIVSHKNKFVFIRVPKTASTSILFHTIKYGNIGEDAVWSGEHINNLRSKNCDLGPHQLLQNIIDKKIISNINNYDIFGVIRDPVDRFISASIYSIRVENGYDNRIIITNEEAVKQCLDRIDDSYLNDKDNMNSSHTRQVEFFKFNDNLYIDNLYTFENIPKLIHNMCGSDSTLIYNYRSGSRKDKSISIDSKYIDKILELYKEDKRLYDYLNKKYC